MAFEENHYAPPANTHAPTTNWGVGVVVFFVAGFQILIAMLMLLLFAADSNPAMSSVLGTIAALLMGLLGIWSIWSTSWRQFASRGQIWVTLYWGFGVAREAFYLWRNPHELSGGIYIGIGIVVMLFFLCLINAMAIGRLDPPFTMEETPPDEEFEDGDAENE